MLDDRKVRLVLHTRHVRGGASAETQCSEPEALQHFEDACDPATNTLARLYRDGEMIRDWQPEGTHS